MPDLIVHVVVAWTICRLLRFKYPQFNQANTALVMLGAVIPDLIRMVTIPIQYLTGKSLIFAAAFHVPFNSILIAGIVSLFFNEKKTTFLFLSSGVLTHYLLDILLIGEGIMFFYPASQLSFHLDLIPTTDYIITIIALSLALIVYIFSWRYEKNKTLN